MEDGFKPEDLAIDSAVACQGFCQRANVKAIFKQADRDPRRLIHVQGQNRVKKKQQQQQKTKAK